MYNFVQTHAYFIGTCIIMFVFGLLYCARKDLRRLMVYGGAVYLTYMTACFLLLRILSSDPAKAINPGYWSPPSLFNLNYRTGGLGIEDVLFMFFVGAIAAGFYEIIFKVKISNRSTNKLKKGHALAIGVLIGAAVYALTPVSAIYFTIIVQLCGALVIIWQRKDLLTNALAGAVFFMLLYVLCFSIFNLIFPSFLADYYNLKRTSHFWLLGLPAEEYLYSFTLGLMWAPIYEYEHRLKDNKRRRSAPRKAVLAVVNARR